MKRSIAISGTCVGLPVLVAAALAQEPPRVVAERAGDAPAVAVQPVPAPPADPKRATVVLEQVPNTVVRYRAVVDQTDAGERRTMYAYVQPEAEPPVQDLLGKWKAAANESDRSKVEKDLRQVLKEQFQARLAAHEKEIEQLEAKVKQLREQLDLRRQKQDEIVDFRAQQLLREAQGLGWGTEPAIRGLAPQPPVAPQYYWSPSPNQATSQPPRVRSAEAPAGADWSPSPAPAAKPATPPPPTR
jgi:hypothetical protein